VNVVDEQANVLVQKRMDGCIHVGIPEFSYAKAYTCVVTNLSSREFRDKYTSENNPAKFCQMNSMIDISGGRMAAFPGGILIRNRDNDVVGAIGVSGASGDEDEYVCLRSVWDSGLPLTTQPKEHSCSTSRESSGLR
jgi:glc operon protein GlcG